MQETKHTPGPWKIAETTKVLLDNARLIRPVDDRNYEFGAVAAITIATSPQNARLIAAAPELLEALEEMTDYVDRCMQLGSRGQKVMSAARAAIAKARGDK